METKAIMEVETRVVKLTMAQLCFIARLVNSEYDRLDHRSQHDNDLEVLCSSILDVLYEEIGA